MKTEFITSSINKNIGIITLNVPQTLNSFKEKMLHELFLQMSEFEKNPDIKVIVLRGNEKSFSAGIDIKELCNKKNEIKTIVKNMQYDMAGIRQIKKPVIAAVAGLVLGIGCELALSCDIILAADNTRFGMPELSINLLPCFGGISLLTNAVGKAKAMEMILSGRAIDADEAERAGMISQIIPLNNLFAEAEKIAARIAMQNPDVVTAAKAVVRQLLREEDRIAYENLSARTIADSNDFAKTLDSFKQKSA